MAVYLDSDKSLKNYQSLLKETYFVDKSAMIALLNERVGTASKYVCITRPRRFGKSSVADMLGAYYSNREDTDYIFSQLKISEYATYKEHLNQYHVINISFNERCEKGQDYESYMHMIRETIRADIAEKYPHLDVNQYFNISRLLRDTKEEFIFIFDEWDYIFSHNLFEEHQDDFLEFLRDLLKDQPYVQLCYMTGVLPIKKYSSGSALNMFDEFTMLSDMLFGAYFGFTEEETKALCDKQNSICFEELREWYNGYLSEEGIKLYNPRSVVKALQSKKCKSYWTNTGAMDEVTEYLKYNTLEVREDVIQMVTGESIDLFIEEEFRAGQGVPKTQKEIYSAMIVLGFLTYHEGYLKIPNKELMREFEKALKDESFGYVSAIIQDSKDMLKATLNEDTKAVEEILHRIHNSEIPILQYNDENSLSCVLTLAYLSARDSYRIEREEKTGKGYADFTFHPRRKNDTAFIVELKKDEEPAVAIKQIRDKEYVQKFVSEHRLQQVLAVAICYDSKNKTHKCLTEKIIVES